MAKEILNKSQPIGGDGASVSEVVKVEDGKLKAVISMEYPLSKVVQPIKDLLHSIRDKSEAAIPGDWDKAVLDPIFAGLDAQIDKILADI
jgi:hypothetical protein